MIVVASAKVSRQVLFLAKTSVIKAPTLLLANVGAALERARLAPKLDEPKVSRWHTN